MQNKKTTDVSEKHSQSCGQHDPLSRIFFGIIIIWLGISLFLMKQHDFFDGEWWAYFLLGLGIIFFVEAIVRMTRTEDGRPYAGKVIAGAVLVAFSAGHIYQMEEWWPLILIVVGVIIIFLGAQKKRESNINQ